MPSASLWRFIKEDLVAEQGKTVVVATHNMDEARRHCDRVAILHHGQVRACGPVVELTRLFGRSARYTLTLHPSTNGAASVIAAVPGVPNVHVQAGEQDGSYVVDLELEDPQTQVSQLLEQVIAAGGNVLACTPDERSLGDVLGELAGSRTQ